MRAVELGSLLPDQVPGLWRFARTLTTGDAQAEDLVQDTLVRALEKADTFRGDASVSTWLHRIMHNLAVDGARRRRETPVEDVVDAVEAAWRDGDYSVDAATVVVRAESRAELEDALIHLPIAYRIMVLLHDAHGMTVQEIADIQSVSLPAAKQRLRRGRMMLVTQLAGGHERRELLRGVPMRCWDARGQVSDYLDGELDEAEAALVERHLATCPTCPPLYTALVATTAALGILKGQPAGLPVRDPNSVIPAALATKIEGLVRQERS
jgi:RNA polymerase sigma-70 factor, ECF subfamily